MRANAPRIYPCSRYNLIFDFNGTTNMKRTLCFAALGLSLFAIAPAFGADGYVTGDVNLRAGPDTSYPSVVMLPAGAEVAIEGCVDGWSWCDVAVGNNRGWVAGNFLQEEYQGQRVLVPEYGVRIGIPVVSFAFGTYWDDNYRNRSWYGNREHWSRVTPRYHAAAVHRDWHDSTREHTNPHPRDTSVDAYRAHEHASVAALRQHESATIRPTEPHAIHHGAPVPRAVAVRSAPQPGIGVEHKAVHKAAGRKNAPGKKDDHGKDQR